MNNNTSMDSISINVIRKIQNPDSFIKIVYNNFNYLDDPNLNHNIGEIKRIILSDTFLGLLLYDKMSKPAKIIGYLVGEFKQLDDGRYIYYITYMFVAKQYRMKNLGSMMMYKIINVCKEHKIKYILLTYDTTDYKLCKFYKKFNFINDPIFITNSKHCVMCLYL
jgi:ribosomal protein S18 acetylase RimI-like enzyme